VTPSLGFTRRGAGEPLVLLHPLGGDRHVWEPVLEPLAAEREVLALDLPGFGDSPPLDDGEPPDPPALARAVAAFAEREFGGSAFHVAGNSLGGWVALELALDGRARSATAIAPAGLWPEPLMPRRGAARRFAQAALPALGLLTASDRGRRLALAGVMAHPDRVPREAAERLVRAYATAPGFDAVNDAMRAGRFGGLDRIPVPVTLAWPEHDRLVGRPAHVPEHVREVVLPGCGHLPMWDDPARVADVLLSGSAERSWRAGAA
jgi:pimeloyl-ACP methyl ester carboxylesterase